MNIVIIRWYDYSNFVSDLTLWVQYGGDKCLSKVRIELAQIESIGKLFSVVLNELGSCFEQAIMIIFEREFGDWETVVEVNDILQTINQLVLNILMATSPLVAFQYFIKWSYRVELGREVSLGPRLDLGLHVLLTKVVKLDSLIQIEGRCFHSARIDKEEKCGECVKAAEIDEDFGLAIPSIAESSVEDRRTIWQNCLVSVKMLRWRGTFVFILEIELDVREFLVVINVRYIAIWAGWMMLWFNTWCCKHEDVSPVHWHHDAYWINTQIKPKMLREVQIGWAAIIDELST